jgi:MFS family permease
MDAQTRPQILAKPRGHGFAQAPTALVSFRDRKPGSERTGREVQISTLLLGQRQFGSAIAGTGVGWIADHWGWNGVFITMVVCGVLTIVFSAMTLGHTAESGTRY